MNLEEARAIVGEIGYPSTFVVEVDHRRADGSVGAMYLQIQYEEPDAHTGKPSLQKGRKWRISPWATKSELLQTALVAALFSAEHRVREHFKYRGRAIYGPHFDADQLWAIADGAHDDVRPPEAEVG